MAKITLSLRCPVCGLPINAEVREFMKFIIYLCPRCSNNVVFYKNKTGILSDKMIRFLKKRKKLKFCGRVYFKSLPKTSSHSENITKDKITNLKILLNTETDFNTLLSKL